MFRKILNALLGKSETSDGTELPAKPIDGQPAYLVAQERFTVGQKAVIEGRAVSGKLMGVFEDDGDTGFFYAVDMQREEQPIRDALHIYNANQVTDRNVPSEAQIIWSGDDRKVLLLINNYPHAVFDFDTHIGYSRNGFPEPGEDSGWRRAEWSDAIMALFPASTVAPDSQTLH